MAEMTWTETPLRVPSDPDNHNPRAFTPDPSQMLGIDLAAIPGGGIRVKCTRCSLSEGVIIVGDVDGDGNFETALAAFLDAGWVLSRGNNRCPACAAKEDETTDG